jgi:hypothetical protein
MWVCLMYLINQMTERVMQSKEEFLIENCARCGKSHPVVFSPITKPIVCYEKNNGKFEKISFNRFGICANTGEPLLMFTVKTK